MLMGGREGEWGGTGLTKRKEHAALIFSAPRAIQKDL
jgi:hypothetical protein